MKPNNRGHILHTPATCQCDKKSDIPCPVCDWGLGVCRICGSAECELDERDCVPTHPNNQNAATRLLEAKESKL